MSLPLEANSQLLLRVRNAAQIVTVCSNQERVLKGSEMKKVAILESTTNRGLSIAVNKAGEIAAVGFDDEVDQLLVGCTVEREIDASGMSVLPGLVDAHTHPVWVGDRVHEFAMKLAGATYMDVHAMGGGIHFTVNQVRQASFEQLYESLSQRLTLMLEGGTTLVEAKSGYGLDFENEHKMLRVIEKARTEHPVSVSTTYCGAHAVPKGGTATEAAQNVIDVQIPALRDLCSSGSLHIDNIDVFCEKGVFDTDTTRRILKEGREAGWNINFHGDELNPMNSGELAAEVGASAVSHLEHVSDTGIQAMAEAGVVGVLLPTTAYILRLEPPPARKMIERGMAVALGSDFNPNAYCMSMPMVMHLACVHMRMTMPEALIASTINAAASLGLSDRHGSIEVGKQGDLLILNAAKWEHLVYQFGCSSDVIKHVVKRGKVVHTNSRP